MATNTSPNHYKDIFVLSKVQIYISPFPRPVYQKTIAIVFLESSQNTDLKDKIKLFNHLDSKRPTILTRLSLPLLPTTV